MLNIFDGNNYARVEFEVDPGGLPLRRLFTKAFFEPKPSIYVFDGKNSKDLRLALYPGYKGKRNAPPDNFMIMLGFYKELLLHTGKSVVEVPGYEADDVIATLVLTNPDVRITIDSTDCDFCALEGPNVIVPKANLKGIERLDVRLYKTLCGDSSDSIGGFAKFGPKAWEALTIAEKDHWKEVLESRTLASADYKALGIHRELFTNWLAQNHQLIQTYWDIVGFYDVPMDLIAKHTRVGVPNFPLAEQKLMDLLQ